MCVCGHPQAALRTVDTHVMEPLAEKGVRAYSNLYAHLPAPEEDTPVGRVLRAAPPASLLDATGLLWRLELSGISVLCRQGLSDSARARAFRSRSLFRCFLHPRTCNLRAYRLV